MKRKVVLLVNLGTPKSPHPKDVFHYLNEFLTDNRVIDLPWMQRQCLVRGMIVPFRYRQSAKLYQHLWTSEGSPLLTHSQNMQKKLQKVLGDEYTVVLAMRYQTPSIPDVLEKFRIDPPDELIILPLFPQYASATTGSVHEKVMKTIQKWQVIPKLVFINSFYDHPEFLKAFCARANQYTISLYDHILFSFHGLPESQIRAANSQGSCLLQDCCKKICRQNRHCYKAQCYATAHAIANQLSLNEKNYSVCFQSRLGKDPWIQPYTTDILKQCAERGDKNLLVFSPSFVCDCLETTLEIGVEYHQEFQKLGGDKLQLIEGLNSHPEWIEALASMVSEIS